MRRRRSTMGYRLRVLRSWMIRSRMIQVGVTGAALVTGVLCNVPHQCLASLDRFVDQAFRGLRTGTLTVDVARYTVWVWIGFAPHSAAYAQDEYQTQRAALVRNRIQAVGVTNRRVLGAMQATPRHEFVPSDQRPRAYVDTALPIGFGQTISSPYIVARMTEALDPQANEKVLEVGTGSGYQAAVLSSLVKDVYTIEIVPELGKSAQRTLTRLRYENVHVRIGDGYLGWPEHAPYDKIIVTCSPEDIPRPLISQLAEGGHLVIPVGERFQQVLYRFTKSQGEMRRERVEATFFVPMTGRAEAERKKHPDASNPRIINGGFEATTAAGELQGWYYIRHGKAIRDPNCPGGKHCMEFVRRDAMPAYGLQPIGVTGANTKELKLTLYSSAEGIQTGLLSLHSSQVVVEFYDKNRQRCGEANVAINAGSFGWRHLSQTISVPKEAELAMIGIGLFGAQGTIRFDDIRVSAISR